MAVPYQQRAHGMKSRMEWAWAWGFDELAGKAVSRPLYLAEGMKWKVALEKAADVGLSGPITADSGSNWTALRRCTNVTIASNILADPQNPPNA